MVGTAAVVRRCAVVTEIFRPLLAVLLAGAMVLSASCAGHDHPVAGHAPTAGVAAAPSAPGRQLFVARAQLPPEARQTLRLIDEGGPFPYRQDGVTFQNREGWLPAEHSGYYREYTVPTPGAGDRGARRIIAGKNGERYYTPDHYRTFMTVQGA